MSEIKYHWFIKNHFNDSDTIIVWNNIFFNNKYYTSSDFEKDQTISDTIKQFILQYCSEMGSTIEKYSIDRPHLDIMDEFVYTKSLHSNDNGVDVRTAPKELKLFFASVGLYSSILALDRDPDVRLQVAKSMKYADFIGNAFQFMSYLPLINDSSIEVKKAIIDNNDYLDCFVNDSDYKVRTYMVEKGHRLKHFVNDPNHTVSKLALRKLAEINATTN